MASSKTVFSKIVSKEKDVWIVYEDASTIAFLDQNPVTKGHCLVIPKEPVDHLDDCSEELYLKIFSTVQKVSKLLKHRLKPERIALVVHGYEIPHAHVHVIPVYKRGDVPFRERPDTMVSQQKLKVVYDLLKEGDV